MNIHLKKQNKNNNNDICTLKVSDILRVTFVSSPEWPIGSMFRIFCFDPKWHYRNRQLHSLNLTIRVKSRGGKTTLEESFPWDSSWRARCPPTRSPGTHWPVRRLCQHFIATIHRNDYTTRRCGRDAPALQAATVARLMIKPPSNEASAAVLLLTWARTTTTMPGSDHVTFQQSAILSWNGELGLFQHVAAQQRCRKKRHVQVERPMSDACQTRKPDRDNSRDCGGKSRPRSLNVQYNSPLVSKFEQKRNIMVTL